MQKMLKAVVLLSFLAALPVIHSCGGIDDSDPSRIGDGIGSTADERNSLNYDPIHGCSVGTEILLNPEPGSPHPQVLCGAIETDPTNDELYVYQGIQYAASTAGDNRWKAPQPPQWSQLRATEYGPTCPQGSGDDTATADISEDCLYLNIWTPKVTPDNSGHLPVMVFIHGGAFIFGSGGSAKGQTAGHLNLYDGSEFVASSRDGGQPVVFVTMNYRLGVLGLLAGDQELLRGNYAIKDQTKALEWVQRNISLFGGDPSNVMIFGESAGAQSVALHLTIRQGDHQSLFERAIMESNYAIAYMKLETAEKKARDFASLLDCDEDSMDWSKRMECLRSKDLSEILTNQLFAYDVDTIGCQGLQAIIPWNPVIDGHFIVEEPIKSPIDKPIITGSNLTESLPFVAPWFPKGKSAQAIVYAALLDFLFGEATAEQIISQYQSQYPDMSIKQRFETVVTDYLWTCFNRELATVPSTPSRRFHFVHHGSFPYWVDAAGEVSGKTAEACALDESVCHAAELPFVFGNPVNEQLIERSFTADEADMSTALRNYWIQFARTDDPNISGQVEWPTDKNGILSIQAPASAIEVASDSSIASPANCETIWNRVGYTIKSAYDCSDQLRKR